LLSSVATPPPPSPTLFPYTTLFRSGLLQVAHDEHQPRAPVLARPGGQLEHRIEDVLHDVDHARRALATHVHDPLHAQELFALSLDRKSTRLNSSHVKISYAVFCLKK